MPSSEGPEGLEKADVTPAPHPPSSGHSRGSFQVCLPGLLLLGGELRPRGALVQSVAEVQGQLCPRGALVQSVAEVRGQLCPRGALVQSVAEV